MVGPLYYIYNWGGGDWDDEPTTVISQEESKRLFSDYNKECLHVWAKYTGLAEQFEFCKHCDLKRPIND